MKRMKRKSKRSRRKPEKLEIKAFKGDPDDMRRFVNDVETKLEYHRKALVKDMDKIRLIVPLLEGKAKKWYEGLHPHIHKSAADRLKIPFDKNHPFRKWANFFDGLQMSFGGSLSRDCSVAEWNKLRHTPGKIDDYLDAILRLMWSCGYGGEVIKDKIKAGLSEDLRKAWATKTDHPEEPVQYIAALRALGHALEDDFNFGKLNTNVSSSTLKGGKQKKGKSDKQTDNGKTTGSTTVKTGSQHKTPYKSFRVEHTGIQGEVLDKR